MIERLNTGLDRRLTLISAPAGFGKTTLLSEWASQRVSESASGRPVAWLSSATLATAMAYVGETTSEEDRGGGMGILGAAMALGVILGPGFGGWLAGDSLSTPFFIAAGMSLVSLLLILFLVPESLPVEARQRAEGKVSTVQPGPTTKRWGEATVIKASLLAGSVGFVVLLLANTYVTILLATGLFILSKTLLRPAAFSLISKRATPSTGSGHRVGQGVAMGLSNSFMSLGRIAGPIWAGSIFDVNFDYPYLSGSVIMFIGFLISGALKHPTDTTKHVKTG